MAARYNPKTLAKTLTFIGYHSPCEYGLFWDPDRSMPWKEFYWALQEDPALRFVRESHIRELTYLGLDLPFTLDGNLLRLRDGFPPLDYPRATSPPERLYHACRRKQFLFVKEHGLSPSSRPFLPLASNRRLAEQLGRRRDPEPLLIEVLARKAALDGDPVLQAGPELYLMQSVSIDYVILPLVRGDQPARHSSTRAAKHAEPKPPMPHAPGSFFMNIQMLGENTMEKPNPGKVAGQKREKGADWKRTGRKERNKRKA